MKESIAAIYGAVIALIVAASHDLFFTKYLKWPESAALTAAVGVGVLLLIAYEAVGGTRVVAKRSSPLSKVQGAWKITVTDNDRPASVCKICFTGHHYLYTGYGINRDGTLGASWSSRDIHYDEDQEEMSFTADATLMKDGRRVRNYGYIKFLRDANKRFEYGNGYFVDMADQLSQSHMTLIRIRDAEFDEIVKGTFSRTKSQESVSQAASEESTHSPADGGSI